MARETAIPSYAIIRYTIATARSCFGLVEVPMQFGLDKDNAVEQFLYHLRFVCFVRVRDGLKLDVGFFVDRRLCDRGVASVLDVRLEN